MKDNPVQESEICEVCGMAHSQCEPDSIIFANHKKLEKELLNEFAINGEYGLSNKASEYSFNKALNIFKTYFKSEVEIPMNQVIENINWWYIPVIWIGCLGYIVEKKSKNIFLLGSGLAGLYADNKYKGMWAAIKAYELGKVEPEKYS